MKTQDTVKQSLTSGVGALEASRDLEPGQVASRAVSCKGNIYIRETIQFSTKGSINDFLGNLNRLTVSRRFTEQAVYQTLHWISKSENIVKTLLNSTVTKSTD